MRTYCITCLWLALSIVFTSAVILSMLSPVWFENSDIIGMKVNVTQESNKQYDATKIKREMDETWRQERQNDIIATFGLLRYCRLNQLDDVMFNCQFYGSVHDMPSMAWLICTIIFALGTGLFVLSVILSTFGMCVNNRRREKLRIGLVYLQIIGVGFLVVAVLMFPLGLDSDFARSTCGDNASMYISADCQVAWGYVLGIMAISLTVFCPILAKYSIECSDDENEYEFDYKSEIVSISPSSNSKIMTTV